MFVQCQQFCRAYIVRVPKEAQKRSRNRRKGECKRIFHHCPIRRVCVAVWDFFTRDLRRVGKPANVAHVRCHHDRHVCICFNTITTTTTTINCVCTRTRCCFASPFADEAHKLSVCMRWYVVDAVVRQHRTPTACFCVLFPRPEVHIVQRSDREVCGSTVFAAKTISCSVLGFGRNCVVRQVRGRTAERVWCTVCVCVWCVGVKRWKGFFDLGN